MDQIIETDTATGRVTVRDMTPAEAAQWMADREAGAAATLERDSAAAHRATLEEQAATALAQNRAAIAAANVTNAQLIAQVKNLSRQNNALIRLVLGLLDEVD